MTNSFKPRAYLKEGCPFSFKFLLFMTESGCLEDIELIRVPHEGAELERTKERLSKALGKPATFPTVEVQPGKFLADSDRLMAHFAKREGEAKQPSATMCFYTQTILPQVVKLHEMEEKG